MFDKLKEKILRKKIKELEKKIIEKKEKIEEIKPKVYRVSVVGSFSNFETSVEGYVNQESKELDISFELSSPDGRTSSFEFKGEYEYDPKTKAFEFDGEVIEHSNDFKLRYELIILNVVGLTVSKTYKDK